ncbi:predicted protein, partial [Nematostella vectensis]
MAKFIQHLIDEIIDQYMYADDTKRPWIIGFSGGKDSTVMLQLVWEAISQIKELTGIVKRDIYVVCNDTMVENPVITEYVHRVLDKIEIAARDQGIPIYVIKTIPRLEDSFWVNLIGRGYPAPNNAFRWCTERLKIRPTSRFILEQVDEFGEAVILIGTRSAESAQRAKSMKKHAIKDASADDYECPTVVTNKEHKSCGQSRRIECKDGVNITANSDDGRSYPAIQMSDGEKVMLYLIAQVLQAPIQGFIVVDEPEMYLHKTILKKLWDILESERSDCLFIYLTHDLDFATSRTTAKKIWIKSFTHPDKWEIEDIPTDQIPESLLFELLGSRKNILFCEGVKGSIDERVYSTLFPELTIMPVGSCFDVINHTKAFNKLSNVNTKAFGIIDSDHHDLERLEKLEKENVYSFKIAEVENLFLDIDFLTILATQLLVDTAKITDIQTDVINELSKLKNVQASNY